MLIDNLYEHTSSKIRWAIGDDVNHGSRPYKNRIKNGTFDGASLLWVNIEDVFRHTESDYTLDINHPTGGENSIGDRVTKAKSFFSSGFMNPSELGYSTKNKSIVFDDGRHRMVAAYQLGAEYAPAIIVNSDIDSVMQIVRTNGSPISFEDMKRILE